MSKTPQGTWLSGAQRGSLWLCRAEPLAEKRKSEISDKRHMLKAAAKGDSLGEEQLGKLGEEEDEEGEPAIEQRRDCTDLGEREEQVVCHASALALAMTDKAHREAEM